MLAVGFKSSLPIDDPNSFLEFDMDTPVPVGHQLLVKLAAASVNPVDYKVRQNSAKNMTLDIPKVIGWDAAGIVEAVGEEVSLFKAGDAVYYAGDITKPGCNAAYQLIDERMAGKKPVSLTNEAAAAMPLTSLTAWELFFDRMRLNKDMDHGKSILLIGGAGGVGSIAIQVAKKLLGLTVIATASRPESADWCRQMGADLVVNHKDLVNEVRQAGFQQVDLIADFADSNGYWDSMAELIKPQGRIGSIIGKNEPYELGKLRSKSVSFSWELMFTRSSVGAEDLIRQHEILNRVGELLDEGTLISTLKHTLQGLSAPTLRKAHAQLESGTTIGKLAIRY